MGSLAHRGFGLHYRRRSGRRGYEGRPLGKNQHVVMHDDRWAVKEEGAATPIATFKTQGQAWEKAKAIARRERSEAVLHGKDGRIRERNTYGADPRSSKG